MKTTNFIEIANENRSLSFGQCQQFYSSAQSFLSNHPMHPNFIKVLMQTDSVLVKFLMAGVNLEFLWQIKYAKPNYELFDRSYELEWENSVSFTDYVFLDNFVHQAISFLDHTKSLALIVLAINRKWRNTEDFFKILSKEEKEKAGEVSNLFKEIYSKGNWGFELNQLRNKISHNQIFLTQSKYTPTINNKEYQRYCQDIENNMFEFLIKIQETLFEVKWISGKN